MISEMFKEVEFLLTYVTLFIRTKSNIRNIFMIIILESYVDPIFLAYHNAVGITTFFELLPNSLKINQNMLK
jgi:hypothetical protein